MNITPRSKRNPWRNTRKDYYVPWNDVLATIFMILLPLLILSFSVNFVLRTSMFYSHYASKTKIVKELGFYISDEDLSDTFTSFMQHKDKVFQLKEKTEYEPQDVFTKRASDIMYDLRWFYDLVAIVSFLLFVIVIAIFVRLYLISEKKLLYESFKHSGIFLAVLLLLHTVLLSVKPISKLIFRALFGVRFEPGDALITIFNSSFPIYLSVATIIVAVLIFIAIGYIMIQLVKPKRMLESREF